VQLYNKLTRRLDWDAKERNVRVYSVTDPSLLLAGDDKTF